MNEYTETLAGHTSPDTAFVVDDYPYGFRLRTKIRYWIETKKGFGQRFCSQTLNPNTTTTPTMVTEWIVPAVS
jgi:hypothetical protein